MTLIDFVIHILMSIFLIFGIYQFYFWCQRQTWRPVRRFESRIDECIPFWPQWVWIYSFLYYPAIVYLNWTVQSPRHFNHLAMSFFILLFMQMACFLSFPVASPVHWRDYADGEGLSRRFLRFVQKFDAPTNCFPSMHVSVATLTAMHASPRVGPASWGFPVLIALSCAFTKQHYLTDLAFGAALGWLAFKAFALMGGAAA